MDGQIQSAARRSVAIRRALPSPPSTSHREKPDVAWSRESPSRRVEIHAEHRPSASSRRHRCGAVLRRPFDCGSVDSSLRSAAQTVSGVSRRRTDCVESATRPPLATSPRRIGHGCSSRAEPTQRTVDKPTTPKPSQTPPRTTGFTGVPNAVAVDRRRVTVVPSPVGPESWATFRNGNNQLGIAKTTLPDEARSLVAVLDLGRSGRLRRHRRGPGLRSLPQRRAGQRRSPDGQKAVVVPLDRKQEPERFCPWLQGGPDRRGRDGLRGRRRRDDARRRPPHRQSQMEIPYRGRDRRFGRPRWRKRDLRLAR